MHELMHRQHAAPPSTTCGTTGHRPPESSSMSELIQRNTAVSAAVAQPTPPSLTPTLTPSLPEAAAPVPAPAAALVPAGPPVGVGIVFKESRRNSTIALVVKSLAPGGPAAASGQIQVFLVLCCSLLQCVAVCCSHIHVNFFEAVL